MILIVSKDSDFSAALAEQLLRELGQACQSVASEEEAKPLLAKADLVVTPDAIKLAAPVLQLKAAPFKMRQILADVKARLDSPAAAESLLFGAFEFSPRQKQLTHKPSGKSVSLTEKEGQLIKTLAAAGKPGVAKDALLKDVWGIEQEMDTHTLETHIYRLRAKFRELGDEQAIAATDSGYRMAVS